MSDDRETQKKRIDHVVSRFFSVFDNRGGKEARLDDLFELCLPECVIIKTNGTSPTIYSLTDFVAPRRRLLNEGVLREFSEEEVLERTTIFGGIAQRFCSYRKSGVLSGERFETQGMKSLQFVLTTAGWKIASVIWDDERDGLVVPSSLRGA